MNWARTTELIWNLSLPASGSFLVPAKSIPVDLKYETGDA